MKKTTLLIIAMLLIVSGMQAQENKKDYSTSYMFVSLQGGATRSFTNGQLERKWAPMGALSLGGYFAPFLGARIQANGWTWKEDQLDFSDTYRSTYYGGNLDLLLNVSRIFYPKTDVLVDAVLLGGGGVHYARFNTDGPTAHEGLLAMKGNRWTSNVRLGGQLGINVTKSVAVLLEGGYHRVHDHYNTMIKAERWWPYAMVGLSYKLGHHTKQRTTAPASTITMQDVSADQQASTGTANRDVTETKPKPKVEEPVKTEKIVKPAPAKQTESIFFRIGQSAIGSQQAATINQIVQWAKDHPEATIAMTGYADKGTGTAKINQVISERRVAAVKDALVKKGIAASRISTKALGDTVQPFSENDQNRVVIVISETK